MKIDWRIIRLNWPNFLHGALVTYYVAALAMCVALAVGLVLAMLQNSQNPLLRAPARLYLEFFRSLPLYVFLLWMYYGIRIALNIGLEAMPTAILSLGLITAAYMAEIYRSGLLAVDKGQYEAGYTVGLSRFQVFVWIILPQMTRIVLPATVNQFIGVLKGATLAGIIGVFDLMYFARNATALTFKPFEFYTVAGVIFISSTLVLAAAAGLLESRYRWDYV
jgi:His/Glu/Gln/Arg/opine family amino acid ABC transporter permease subunit